ncbi:DUF423 domain-containing protein [Siansivirga zeaxanthinifaciens]|uniref:Membrane protein n=1 Tax=Siansivirga zeaxanthinifaciens CC-SAMT-1 TaxID=1454006 RepID=A0A0C5VTW7_9FLAO|nr:DUF423 domain-containing protein [Siansivirga zeaxanthinifaciens]AJR02636.1 membrane protein [Siansivirga zeaxanthinifaciens CC-SAMT-1]
MDNKILITAAIFGVLSIVLGAFGAHALKELIPVTSQQTFETGVRYQMYHALFLLFIGSANLLTQKTKNVIYYLTLIGVVFFSGSIYFLATNTLTNFDFKVIGFITPIGGLLLMLSWLTLFVNFLKNKC